MAPTKQSPGFVPGRGYSQEDWDDVSDNPQWTTEDLAEAKPFAEAFPELAKSMAEEGVVVVGDPKVSKIVALDRKVVEKFQSEGGDWQGRINDILRKAVGL
jgi:uncharacterized protein (DUF4415 family)